MDKKKSELVECLCEKARIGREQEIKKETERILAACHEAANQGQKWIDFSELWNYELFMKLLRHEILTPVFKQLKEQGLTVLVLSRHDLFNESQNRQLFFEGRISWD